MKKILIFSLFFICLNASAQIQRTFLGNTFGDTIAQVISKMRNNGYGDRKISDELLYTNVSFGGVNGWNVHFRFNNGKFYCVEFIKNDNSKYTLLTDISKKIASKYPQYVIENYQDYYGNDFLVFDGGCKFSDGNVTCFMFADKVQIYGSGWEYMSHIKYQVGNSGRYSSTDDF